MYYLLTQVLWIVADVYPLISMFIDELREG